LRGGFTRKVHCLSDARGIPLVFHLTPGEAADGTAFEEVIALAEERPAYLLADKGYDSDAIRASLHGAGIRSCIPPKSNRKAKIRWNRRMYRETGTPCRSPAMTNGRCRMHGGTSPGAPKGNSHALRHGRYTAEAIAERREFAALLRDMKGLVRMVDGDE
jgi:IS5 family transposase